MQERKSDQMCIRDRFFSARTASSTVCAETPMILSEPRMALALSLIHILFEYLSMQYVNPLLVLDSLMKPESTDRKGQKIYRVKAFLAAEAASPEGRLIACLLYTSHLDGMYLQSAATRNLPVFPVSKQIRSKLSFT